MAATYNHLTVLASIVFIVSAALVEGGSIQRAPRRNLYRTKEVQASKIPVVAQLNLTCCATALRGSTPLLVISFPNLVFERGLTVDAELGTLSLKYKDR